MKLIAVLIILMIIVLVAWLAYTLATQGLSGIRRRQKKSTTWTVDPRSLPDNRQEIYLVRGDSISHIEEFFFWPTTKNRNLDFDMALLEAEYQAREFNRVRKELGR